MDIILYNPLSRNGKSHTIVMNLKDQLEKERRTVQIESIFEIQSVPEFIQSVHKDDRLIVVGGDGTLHHLVNSIRGYKIETPIYILKAGTGNDFIRSLKTKESLILINPHIFDLPRATIDNKESLFLNACGIGIDALVCEYVNASTKKKNSFNYFRNTLKAFMSFKPSTAIVTVDGKTKTYKKVWFVLVTNSVYMGGGMKFSPKSIRHDDKLELQVIDKVPRWLLFLIFPTIYFGWHRFFKPFVHFTSGKNFNIQFGRAASLQMDGEAFLNVSEVTVNR